jgi:hypothetical protein
MKKEHTQKSLTPPDEKTARNQCLYRGIAAPDLTRVLLALWTRDDLIFIPERYRVQTTFIIHVYCWTGARLSAFFTDGLRYKVDFSTMLFAPCLA